jgi:tetratricopeptide (TPR) repeat protein
VNDICHQQITEGNFPNDDELIVSQGSVGEWLATQPDADRMQLPENRVTSAIAIKPAGSARQDLVMLNLSTAAIYERCARLYEKALRRSPALDDARVRLGHVLLHLGRPAEALRALEPLTVRDAGSLPRELRYLVALFQGRAWLATGKAEAAAAAYRQALALYPGCQAAQVTLSTALGAAGDQAGARAVMSAMLAGQQRSNCSRDPWLDYLQGQPWRLEALLSRLESGVRR